MTDTVTIYGERRFRADDAVKSYAELCASTVDDSSPALLIPRTIPLESPLEEMIYDTARASRRFIILVGEPNMW